MSKRRRESKDEAWERGDKAAPTRPVSLDDYTIGWICALPIEMAAAKSMLDFVHPDLPKHPEDRNAYILGAINSHNIVITCLASGRYGTNSAAVVCSQMRPSFPSLKYCLMVGVGGGAPSQTVDIRLGDVVVSKPTGNSPGVVQYDYGKTIAGGTFQQIGVLDKPPMELLTAMSKLQSKHLLEPNRILDFIAEACSKFNHRRAQFRNPGVEEDILFTAEYEHVNQYGSCQSCDVTMVVPRHNRVDRDPVIYYGLIASGNQVIKDAKVRDQIIRELDVYCFEMEAAGIMDNFPCLVIRGICDYSDSHKAKNWQGYAAATAAAYAKELISSISPC
ncbi:hypothetical protein H072_1871 [Dactylellina haptotyla CBS 200.50]|uniref:Uncharacterized protein n=1 Tax=Dactylellina haptotyla (strain CBS 200.50) TaxID=1284197 RepID=S8AMR2_DACHA|nr:hypothetical protein H072_1871 [Dactylellina haptotyla CBS 200.50]